MIFIFFFKYNMINILTNKQLNGKSMMTIAIENDAYECMQYLVDCHIDLEQGDRSGVPFLYF